MAKISYIWELPSWPHFRWDTSPKSPITMALQKAKESQIFLLAQAHFFEAKDEAEFFIEEAFTTSAIEGELLDRESIRSSVAKRLGLETAGLPQVKRDSDGLVEVLMDATTNSTLPLTHERFHSWQVALFPTGHSGMRKIEVGTYRTDSSPMQVISGRIGNEKVHFQAPPSVTLKKEMDQFLYWWNKEDNENNGNDGIINAAIAHLWFVTIHPFDDGNGRIARAITDMSLARTEKSSKRRYSLSSQILKDKNSYYEVLEKTQKGNSDITEWILWFLTMFTNSIENSKSVIEKTIFIGKFYRTFADKNFSERQWKVIKKLLESFPKDFEGGLTNKKYTSIAGVSSETAKRDLKELLDCEVLLQNEGKGRSTSYRLNRILK